MRSTLIAASIIPFCFGGGWLIGSLDMSGIKKVVIESYINRYNAASGANVDEIIYYVVSDNQTDLEDIASTDKNIRQVQKTGYPRMFNVSLSYTERRESLKTLRQLDSVSAVFTVPFICH